MAKYEDYFLRNLQETDLEKVLTWRNSERVRINMYTNHIITWEEHLAWFQKIQKKENVIYLIFEFLSRPIGLICFTDLDRRNNKALGGFELGEVDTSPRSGIAMEYLG
jgi:RimJ/RimL family protein N-acetyltransferase